MDKCELSNLPPQVQAQISNESAQDNSGCVENNCKCDNASEKTESVTEAFKSELEPRPQIEQTKLTREEILGMEPGPELDFLVIEKVLGWKLKKHRPSGLIAWFDGEKLKGNSIKPSTDISAAWEVFTHFDYQGRVDFSGDEWYCEVMYGFNNAGYAVYKKAEGKMAPEAICKAALLAVAGESS